MLCDSHCHISKNDYENIQKLLDDAKNNGVDIFINNATDTQSIKEVIQLSNLYDNMYAAIGIHPQAVEQIKSEDFTFLESKLDNPKVVAIGEIGLDYHYTKENKEQQKRLFEKQLSLAQEYNLPVIIHNREATEDIINILKKFKLRGVIHCFSGSLQTARQFIDMGFYLGINGVVTFKNCKTKDVLKQLSLENFVLETDCPYLTPEPYRGIKNEPKYIRNIADYVADIFQTNISQVEKITNKNINHIFDI